VLRLGVTRGVIFFAFFCITFFAIKNTGRARVKRTGFIASLYQKRPIKTSVLVDKKPQSAVFASSQQGAKQSRGITANGLISGLDDATVASGSTSSYDAPTKEEITDGTAKWQSLWGSSRTFW
jgi:hypothetical protein